MKVVSEIKFQGHEQKCRLAFDEITLRFEWRVSDLDVIW